MVKAAATSFLASAVLLGCQAPHPASESPRGSNTLSETRTLPPDPTSHTAASQSPSQSASRPGPALSSIQDLAAAKASYSNLRRLRLLSVRDTARRFLIEFTSDGRTVSGTLTVPAGSGPFPAVVSVHGYVPASEYTVGQGLVREEQILAARGFAVLHPDLSGYGDSSPLPLLERNLGLAYAQDVINAVHALQGLDMVDERRIGLVGRSLGGLISLNVLVTHPKLVRAAVVYAPASTRFQDNLHILHLDQSGAFHAFLNNQALVESPETTFRQLSPRSRFGKITVPILIQQGTADKICPPAWSRETLIHLRGHGVDAKRKLYPGEGHVFGRQTVAAAKITADFLEHHLQFS